MAQATATHLLQYILSNIPRQILELAFEPRKYNTSVESRIISEIIEGPILLDVNLVGGKRKDIFVSNQWELKMDTLPQYGLVTPSVESAFFRIPAEAREGRNISSVIGLSDTDTASLPGTSLNGNGQFGNTAPGMLSQMLNTRTFGMTPHRPQVSLEGTNIVRVHPAQFVEGISIAVMLEYDSEFLNLNNSGIVALKKLSLCATQRYIANQLRVSIDETQVVAGMEIGIIKEIVNDYLQKAEDYDNLLIKVKGAMMYEPRTFSKLVRYMI